ncbi:MAG: hypothetical protein K0S32_3308 [Bacteroidetes bacterium]|jgi:hypothetical protein|nr:hypothetical protein [Bacteroidota bacterium]
MKKVITCIFLLSIFLSFSQVTNTRKWRKTEKDSLDNALLLYDEKNYLIALPIFDNIYHNHPKEEFIKYIFGRCALCRSDKHEEAYSALTEVYTKNKKVQDIEYDLAKAAHLTNKFDEASTLVESYLKNKRISPEGRKDAELLRHYISNAKFHTANPTKAKITNLGSIINTGADEYVPTITADESMMIYTYAGPKSKGGKVNAFLQPDPNGQYTEDIYLSVKENDQFAAPIALDSINTPAHDAAISLSHDGQILFIYRDNGDDHGDIYQSFMIGEHFSKPVKLKGQVNSYSWDGHCSLAPDGKTLFFSSERPGGYGGRDIYRAALLPDSTWGNVVNMGDSINTIYDDDAPFIHPDGITLYFSSKGRTSMGGYDIFQCTMNPVDSSWKMTEHMGYPINSTDDDIYFVLSAYGTNGYYSSGKKGGSGLKDLYLIETNFPQQKMLYMVKGKTTSEKNPVEADIKIEMTSKNNKVFKQFSSNEGSGNYLVTLPAGSEYKITYTYKDKSAQVFTLSTIGITGFTSTIHDVVFENKDTVKTVITPTITSTVVVTPTVAVVTNTAPVKTDNFVPRNKVHEKIMKYVEKYGDVSAEGLEFRVQIAAYKFPKNYTYKHLKGLGKVENLLLDDGITRITIGGNFSTIGKAWEHNKKVINKGQTDAFVTALYKGKRVYLEDLEKMGIYVQKQ